jgi:hypothetical protein
LSLHQLNSWPSPPISSLQNAHGWLTGFLATWILPHFELDLVAAGLAAAELVAALRKGRRNELGVVEELDELCRS